MLILGEIESKEDVGKIMNPFLKWAGGKRWFVRHYSQLLPQEYNRYIEPFLGGGAVFFHLKPELSTLGDANTDLIDTYSAIKMDWKEVFSALEIHQELHCKEHYYKIRDSETNNLYEKAANFIYLNRTCWNGLYRVNLKGKFNVPIGSKSKVILDDDNFQNISECLKNASLLNKDFEYLIDQADQDDLIFVDPPYTVRHNQNGFIKYNEKLFSWDDQERLYYSLKRALRRGAKIVGTNAYHDSVKDLYKDTFELSFAERSSTISSNLSNRKKFEELIISTEVLNV